MKLTDPQRVLLTWLADYSKHNGFSFLTGPDSRCARALVRKGLAEEGSGRRFRITEAGRELVG